MARPKKEPELVTTHRVTIRFSDTQYAVISEDAKRAGLPLADYLRKLIANHGLTLSYKIVRDDKAIHDLTVALGRIGNMVAIPSMYDWSFKIIPPPNFSLPHILFFYLHPNSDIIINLFFCCFPYLRFPAVRTLYQILTCYKCVSAGFTSQVAHKLIFQCGSSPIHCFHFKKSGWQNATRFYKVSI